MRLLFDGMYERNDVCWAAMISGYTKLGKIGNVVSLFEEMPERDVQSWKLLLLGAHKTGF